MKRTILFTIIYLFLISSGINAQTESDTVWTKNIWPLYVTDALFSPDGSKIYISCDNLDKTDRQVRIYDTETGDSLKVIKGITSIFAFSQDGKYKYSHDPTYKMDAETDEILYELNLDEISKDFKGIILRPPSFSPQSNMIFYSGYINLYQPEPNVLGLLIRLNAENLELIDFKIEDQYNSNNTHGIIDVSPDGKYFVTTFSHEDYKTELQLWDAHTFEKIKVLETRQTQDPKKPNYGTFTYFRFSPDSKMLGVITAGSYEIYDMLSFSKIKTYQGTKENGGANILVFSPNSNYLIFGSGSPLTNNDVTKITDTKTWNIVYSYPRPYCAWNAIDISTDSKHIFAAISNSLYMLNSRGGIDAVQEPVETDFYIKGQPNPVNNELMINYSLPKSGFAQIYLSDMKGQGKIIIYEGNEEQGLHNLKFPIQGLSSGVYFLTIEQDGNRVNDKIIITK